MRRPDASTENPVVIEGAAPTPPGPSSLITPPKVLRTLYLGFDPDWKEKFGSTRNAGMATLFYDTSADIPVDEPAPDFLRINGAALSDDAIASLLQQRSWNPLILRVAGRWNSRFQTFLRIRSRWIIPAVVIVALLVCALLVIGARLLMRITA